MRGLKALIMSIQVILGPIPTNSMSFQHGAVAELPELLRLAAGMLANGGVCLFPKGRSCDSEIRVARENWKFALTQWPSLTDPDARILEIGDIVRVTST